MEDSLKENEERYKQWLLNHTGNPNNAQSAWNGTPAAMSRPSPVSVPTTHTPGNVPPSLTGDAHISNNAPPMPTLTGHTQPVRNNAPPTLVRHPSTSPSSSRGSAPPMFPANTHPSRGPALPSLITGHLQSGQGNIPTTTMSLTNVPVQYPDSVSSSNDEFSRSPQYNGPQRDEFSRSPQYNGPQRVECFGLNQYNGHQRDEFSRSPQYNGPQRDEFSMSPQYKGPQPQFNGLQHDEYSRSPQVNGPQNGGAKLQRMTGVPCEHDSLPNNSDQPPVVDVLKRKISTLEFKSEQLQRQIETLQRENISLRMVLTASDNEKDKKIGELHTLYSQTSDRLQKQTMFTKSLADKVMQMTLEQNSRGESRSTQDAGAASSSSASLNQNDKQLIGKITVLAQENSNLKKKYDHVCELNEKWQRYNDEREQKMRDLMSKMEDLESHRTLGSATPNSQQIERMDLIIANYKSQKEVAERTLIETKADVARLQSDVDEKTAQLMSKEDEISILKRQISSIQSVNKRGSKDSSTACAQHDERIMLLETQVQTYSEDFHKERQARERAMSKIANLESELAVTKSMLQGLQTCRMEGIANRRQAALQNQENEYYNEVRNQGYHAREFIGQPFESDDQGVDEIDSETLITGDVITGSGDELTVRGGLDGVRPGDVITTRGPPVLEITPTEGDAVSPPQHIQTLECTKCNMQFPKEKHMDLLNHMEQCMK